MMNPERREIRIRDYETAADKTRELSAKLRASTNNICFYNFFYKIDLIKNTKEDVLESASLLMRLSNSYFSIDRGVENSDTSDLIREKLGIVLD